jgi:hypothetical protein
VLYTGYGEAKRDAQEGNRRTCSLSPAHAVTGLMANVAMAKAISTPTTLTTNSPDMQCPPDNLRPRYYQPTEGLEEATEKEKEGN